LSGSIGRAASGSGASGRKPYALLVLAAIATMGATVVARAHPHVFVEARAVLSFDGSGAIETVRNEWTFDAAYSAFAVAGLDADQSGAFEVPELEPLARLNVEALADYGYFTDVVVDRVRQAFAPPTNYGLVHDGVYLTLFFELRLEQPPAPGDPVTLQVFDPSYFVAFAFSNPEQLVLSKAPPDCSATYYPPPGLHSATMAALNALPSSQRTPPPALAAVTGNLAGYHTISCPAAPPGPAPPVADEGPPVDGAWFDESSPRPE
jgi:ABC-type uncharacterized transport system substrate-binding protein